MHLVLGSALMRKFALDKGLMIMRTSQHACFSAMLLVSYWGLLNASASDFPPFQQGFWQERYYTTDLPDPFGKIQVRIVGDDNVVEEFSVNIAGVDWFMDITALGPLENVSEPDVVFWPRYSEKAEPQVSIAIEYGRPEREADMGGKGLSGASCCQILRKAIQITIDQHKEFTVSKISP